MMDHSRQSPALGPLTRHRIEQTVRATAQGVGRLSILTPPTANTAAACVVLAEAEDFFDREDGATLAEAIATTADLTPVQVSFVPPRFLISRQDGSIDDDASFAAWKLHEEAVLTAIETASADVTNVKTAFHQAIRIVSLADLRTVVQFRERHRRLLSQKVGAPVLWEHICLPPAGILLSDIIFHDYFQPRLPQAPFSALDEAASKLRAATLIVVDDGAEMLIGSQQICGALSHEMRRDPAADLISVRTQRYAAHHHELPLTVVAGTDMRLADRTAALQKLARYLDKPIFRIAGIEPLAPFTGSWDYRPLTAMSETGGGSRELDPDALVGALAEWIKARNLQPVPGRETPCMMIDDLGHYCSHMAVKEDVDRVLGLYDRYCIAGQASSVPYIATELDRLGKSYVRAPGLEPEMLASAQPYDCLLICGPPGLYPIDGPAVAIMKSAPAWRALGITDALAARAQYSLTEEAFPASGSDWYYPFPLDRSGHGRDFAPAAGRKMQAFRDASRRRQERLQLRRQRTGEATIKLESANRMTTANTERPVKETAEQRRETRRQAMVLARQNRVEAARSSAKSANAGSGELTPEQLARREARKKEAELKKTERVATRKHAHDERRQAAAKRRQVRQAAE